MGILPLPLIGPLLQAMSSPKPSIHYTGGTVRKSPRFMIQFYKGSSQGPTRATSLPLAWLTSGSNSEQTS